MAQACAGFLGLRRNGIPDAPRLTRPSGSIVIGGRGICNSGLPRVPRGGGVGWLCGDGGLGARGIRTPTATMWGN